MPGSRSYRQYWGIALYIHEAVYLFLCFFTFSACQWMVLPHPLRVFGNRQLFFFASSQPCSCLSLF